MPELKDNPSANISIEDMDEMLGAIEKDKATEQLKKDIPASLETTVSNFVDKLKENRELIQQNSTRVVLKPHEIMTDENGNLKTKPRNNGLPPLDTTYVSDGRGTLPGYKRTSSGSPVWNPTHAEFRSFINIEQLPKKPCTPQPEIATDMANQEVDFSQLTEKQKLIKTAKAKKAEMDEEAARSKSKKADAISRFTGRTGNVRTKHII